MQKQTLSAKSELLDTAQHTPPVSEELPEFAAVCTVIAFEFYPR